MLNGFGYAIFGVPSRDLETTWRDVTQIGTTSNIPGQSPLLGADQLSIIAGTEHAIMSREFSIRRFSKTRLYNGGRILHIARRKKTELEK